MKKTTSRNNSKKIKATLFASAATLALATTSHAQSSVDALLNKLEQKGILTADETQSLRAENELDATNDFNSALNQKLPFAPWVNSIKFNGSFRGRYEQFSALNSDTLADRDRFRYRLLAGITISMAGNLEAGFRLGSGDSKGSSVVGNPLSQNSTLQDNFSDKGIYIDTAYGKWTPIHNDNWQLSGTVGKMENPFKFTPMVFDLDLTPEGGAIQSSYVINDKNSIDATGAIFVLDEEAGTTQDPIMYGGQVTWNAKWTSKLQSALGLGAFSIVNSKQLTSANVIEIVQGNTRTAAGALVHNYDPIIADASLTYTLDSFPLYAGAFPIKLQGEFMDNTGAPDDINKGYWAGIVFGKSGKKGTWDISYRYEYLESDAWYDQMADDDNVAYYHAAPGGGGSAGFVGGTDVKGHLIKLTYSLTDAFSFDASCFINDLIHSEVNGVNEPGNHSLHFFADIMWKF